MSDATEAMRAKCEAVARNYKTDAPDERPYETAMMIASRIAALAPQPPATEARARLQKAISNLKSLCGVNGEVTALYADIEVVISALSAAPQPPASSCDGEMREALEEVRKRIYDCKHNAMFSSKETIVNYMYKLLPKLDAALARDGADGEAK